MKETIEERILRLSAQAEASEGMGRAAEGCGATLMAESYFGSAESQRAEVSRLRAQLRELRQASTAVLPCKTPRLVEDLPEIHPLPSTERLPR